MGTVSLAHTAPQTKSVRPQPSLRARMGLAPSFAPRQGQLPVPRGPPSITGHPSRVTWDTGPCPSWNWRRPLQCPPGLSGSPSPYHPAAGSCCGAGGGWWQRGAPPPLHNCPALAAPALFFQDGATALVTPDGFCRRSRCWQGPAALRGSGRAGTGHPQATSPRPRWPSWCWEPSRPLGRGDIPLPLPPVSHPAPGWDQGWWGAPGPMSLLPQP